MADVPIERFGGLDLRSDPEEVGAEKAISLNNVDLSPGRCASRAGYAQFTDSLEDAQVLSIFPDNLTATSRIMGATTTDLIVWNSDGSVFAREADASTGGYGAHSYAAVGGATPAIYVAVVDDSIYKWDGATFSTIALANFPQVAAWQDRLVRSGGGSRVSFSAAGDPDAFDLDDFVDVTSGDGESVVGMRVWRELLFVFKETKFFVFYDVSTDVTGGAIFNYRTVDTGVGLWGKRAVSGTAFASNTLNTNPSVAASDALYFLGRDGIYRTTGGPPELVSRALDPMFLGTADTTVLPNTRAYMEEFDSKILTSVSTDDGYRQIVYDRATGDFTIYSLPAGPLCGVELTDGAPELLFGGTAANHVYQHSDAQTTDNGSAISWHYQSGFYDLGSQNSKRSRQTALWGSGSPTVSVFTDHGTTDANAAAVTLGTAPAVARGWHRKAYRGVLFSHKLSGTTAATVHRISHAVTDERQGR